MSLDLTGYPAIQSNLFVRIQVDEYRTSPGAAYSPTVLTFSDMLIPYTINSEEYTGLGKLMSITSSSSELRVSGGELTITLSGIPNTAIAEIVNSKIKGSPVRIYRALFDANTNQLLSVSPNPLGRYRGFVNNYSLNEDYDADSRTASNTLVLVCASSVDVLQNKIAGRKTNPESQKRYYPTDLSMDRVPALENSTFDFGAPKS